MKNPRFFGDEIFVEGYGKRYIKRNYEIDGKPFDFHCFEGIISVITFALTENNEVVAEKQFRFGANAMVIELPGMNKGTLTSVACARKGLEKETGYIGGKVHIFKPVWIDPAAVTVPFIPAVIAGCKPGGKVHLAETDVLKTVLIPLKKWLEMIYSGKVNDNKSITTTMLALKFLA
jgi:hypothetical protein